MSTAGLHAQIFIAWGRATNDQSLLQETLAYLEQQRQLAETQGLLWYQIFSTHNQPATQP